MSVLVTSSLIIGIFFIIVASIGILTLPDLYTRMHAATKAGTLGLGFVLLTVALYFQEVTVTSRVIGTVMFIFLTAPIAAQVLGKVMLQKGYKIWKPATRVKDK